MTAGSQNKSVLPSHRGASMGKLSARERQNSEIPIKDLGKTATNQQELIEMQVHIPKIRISKYFKTKY
jgi:hypothetical protein